MLFIYYTLLGIGLACGSKSDFTPVSEVYPFKLHRLPYRKCFLKPVLTSEILNAHHDHHHQIYVDKLNAYVQTVAALQNKGLPDLLAVSKDDIKLQKFAGGVYNHYLYWWVLTSQPRSRTQPEGSLLQEIIRTWGSFADFKTAWDTASNNIFGSGYVWLVVNLQSKLEIRTTANQISPLMGIESGVAFPFFTNDIWEHTYYLKYKWDRASYVTAFWNIVDWDIVEYFYDTYASNLKAVPL